VWPSLRVAQSEAVRVARTFRARADAHAALSRDFARFLPLWSRSLP
jgi:hypothetical protein